VYYRLDSTYIKTPVARTDEPQLDADQPLPTEVTTNTHSNVHTVPAFTSASTVVTSTTAPTVDTRPFNGSVRSAWGSAFIPNPSSVQEHLTDVSTEATSAFVQKSANLSENLPTTEVFTGIPVAEQKQAPTRPNLPDDAVTTSSPQLSVNPALWAQPSGNGAANLNSSIRVSWYSTICLLI